MNKLFFSILIILSANVHAHQKIYTVANAHAHNDYLHLVPFLTAWSTGFGSIEADVFPIKEALLVAHDSSALQPKRTLEHLYIEPLVKELKKNVDRKVNLLIDIKENYKESLQLLIKELKPLKKYLYTNKDTAEPLTILISGERPREKSRPGEPFV